MLFNSLFSTAIYVLIIFMVILIIRVYMYTIRFNKIGKEKYATLETSFQKEKIKGKIINEHMALATNLEQALFNRFFEISKELIVLQKLLLNSNSL